MRLLWCLLVLVSFQADAAWYKGNTHCHTTESDGDGTPTQVIRWYVRHGYDFLVLSDHNRLTIASYQGTRPFLLIPGEELTPVQEEPANTPSGRRRIPIHVNGLNLTRAIPPLGGNSYFSLLQRMIDAVRGQGGIPHINHPNWKWAVDHHLLLRAENYKLFEIYNGGSGSNNEGGVDDAGQSHPSLEQVWDGLLTIGKRIFAIAVDDAHEYFDDANAGSPPGTGWVVVHAKDLSAQSILESLEMGQFYATNGIEILEYDLSPTEMRLNIAPTAPSYVTEFVDRGGVVLAREEGLSPSYKFTGNELYVRARVISSDNKKAWLQPYFLTGNR